MGKPIPEAVVHAFVDWLAKEMQPGTYITSPEWWASRIIRQIEFLTAAQQPGQEGGGVCTKCRGTGEVCTGYIDGTPEMFDCTCPAAAPPIAPVGVPVAQVRRGGKGAPHDALYAGLIPRGPATPEVKEGDLLYLTQQPAQAAPGDVSDSERNVIETLLELAYAAWGLADNTEDAGDDGLTVERSDFALLEKHLNTLDDLPDDQPGYTMGEAAKARWALRRLIGATPPGDDAAGGGHG